MPPTRPMVLAPRLLLILAAALLLLAACSDDDDDAASTNAITETPNAIPSQAGPQEQPTPAQRLDPIEAEPVDDVIEISLADSAFAPNLLHVPLGSAVTIRLTNDDSLSHSLRVAGIDGMYETEDDAIIDVVNSGASGELLYSGAAAGRYTFRCDLHPSTMGGVIVVD